MSKGGDGAHSSMWLCLHRKACISFPPWLHGSLADLYSPNLSGKDHFCSLLAAAVPVYCSPQQMLFSYTLFQTTYLLLVFMPSCLGLFFHCLATPFSCPSFLFLTYRNVLLYSIVLVEEELHMAINFQPSLLLCKLCLVPSFSQWRSGLRSQLPLSSSLVEEGMKALSFCLLNKTDFLKAKPNSCICYGSMKRGIDHHNPTEEYTWCTGWLSQLPLLKSRRMEPRRLKYCAC